MSIINSSSTSLKLLFWGSNSSHPNKLYWLSHQMSLDPAHFSPCSQLASQLAPGPRHCHPLCGKPNSLELVFLIPITTSTMYSHHYIQTDLLKSKSVHTAGLLSIHHSLTIPLMVKAKCLSRALRALCLHRPLP